MCNKIKAVPYSEKLCFKCLKEKEDINTYEMAYRGWGSIYDGERFRLQLCDECNKEELKEWFDEESIIDDYAEEYIHEENIENFINDLPIQGQELVKNTCCLSGYYTDSQEWIDMELGVAADEVYKENNRYSPSEIKAYEDRFPTCANVYKKIYPDGSSGCRCDYGAYGNSDGTCGVNICDKCYYCKMYEKKNNDSNMRVKEEFGITKDEIKQVAMNEWTCKKCGNINHSYLHEEYLVCDKCGEIHEYIKD